MVKIIIECLVIINDFDFLMVNCFIVFFIVCNEYVCKRLL